MKKDRKALVKKASDYILHKSTIPQGLKALYLEAESSMLQLSRVHRRLTSVLHNSGVTTKESPELTALKGYYAAVKQAAYYFDEFIEKMCTDATYGANEGENKVLSYDAWKSNANAFSLLSLLYFDRTYCDVEQRKKIFDFLSELNGHGLFDENDYKYFEVDDETD